MSEPMAILNDLTKCLGCRSCQVACKAWNHLPGQQTRNEGSYENPLHLSDQTWTRLCFYENQEENRPAWVFSKRQCMHCLEPACVAACPVGAMQKTASGPVVYHKERCIGCRYCMVACPYTIPRFDWHSSVPYITKCTMCSDRMGAGMPPACTQACPNEALVFGTRKQMLALARERLAREPGNYVTHIYGEHEAGGASVLYLSPVAFERLGLPTLGRTPVSHYSSEVMEKVPLAFVGVAAALGAVYWVSKRREELKQDKRNPDASNDENS